MKALHILRSMPDEETQWLISTVSKGMQNSFFYIFTDTVDYDDLVSQIFIADRVISWW